MQEVEVVFAIGWAAFWMYWLVAAFSMKRGRVPWARELRIRALIVVLAIVLLRFGAFRGHGLNTDPWRAGLGLVLFTIGLGFAIWARVHIGRNWGTPMSQKNKPELVTSGPYHLIRHPIYSGVLLAGVGTAVALSWLWLIAVALGGSTSSTARPWRSATWPSSSPEPTRCIGARRRCSCPSSSRRMWPGFNGADEDALSIRLGEPVSALVRSPGDLNFVLFDVVEVLPSFDRTQITAHLAAQV